jgi:hypothetical protein
MHRLSLLDFANVSGFGVVRDRRHVIGFQPHGFSRSPAPPRALVLRRLDLIGLVMHEEPVAYISDKLPSMEILAEATTRPLDDFEKAGLRALQWREDLFIRKTADIERLLGAIRSAKQCVACHGGRRGDLLGAFSYTFTPESQAP